MMKKFCVLSAFIFILSAAAFPVAALAEDSLSYPGIVRDPLEFTMLTDYAAGDDGSFLFADGDALIKWSANEQTVRYSAGAQITGVDFAGGEYFYRTVAGSYTLPESNKDMPGAASAHEFADKPPIESFPKDNGCYYYYDPSDGSFRVFVESNEETLRFDGYQKIKPYGNVIYAVKDNRLYAINGGQAVEKNFWFSNYYLLTQVSAGDSAANLKIFSESPRKVAIKPGCYITKLSDPDNIVSGNYFNVAEDDAKNNTFADVTGQALLLAEAEQTYVVSIGKEVYMLNKESASEIGAVSAEQLQNGKAVPDCDDFAYALPFASASTRSFAISPADKLEVLACIPSANNEGLAHDFYLVQKNGLRGYVPSEFLNDLSYDFNEGGASLTEDPSADDGDNVKTVIIVLLVILLVLIAAGYMTWLLTGGKKFLKNKARQTEQNASSAPPEEDGDPKNGQ